MFMKNLLSTKGYHFLLPVFFALQAGWTQEGDGSNHASSAAPCPTQACTKAHGGFFSMSPGFFHRSRFGDHLIKDKNFGIVSAQGLSLEVNYRLTPLDAVGFSVSLIGANFTDSQDIDGSNVYGLGLIYYRYFFTNQTIVPVPGFRLGFWREGYNLINDPTDYYWGYSFRNIYFGGPCLKFNVGFHRISLQGELSLLLGIRQLMYEGRHDILETELVKSSFASCLDFHIGLQYQSRQKSDAGYKTTPMPPPNTVFMDLGGPGGFWALAYERRLWNSLHIRAGFSYWNSRTDGDTRNFIILPYSVNYLLGNASHKLEFGIGSRMFWDIFKAKILDRWGTSEETAVERTETWVERTETRFDEIIPTVGYRLIADPIILRFYFSHLISKYSGSSGIQDNGPGFPWIGASIGYAF